MASRNLFHKAHYNKIAARLRERLEVALSFHSGGWKNIEKEGRYYAIEALVRLSLDLAWMFREDNEGFNPLVFLEHCSPNQDLYPLTELWEDYVSARDS